MVFLGDTRIGRSPWELTSALELAFVLVLSGTNGATPALMGKSWLVIGRGGVKTSKKMALEKHVNSHGDLPMSAETTLVWGDGWEKAMGLEGRF